MSAVFNNASQLNQSQYGASSTFATMDQDDTAMNEDDQYYQGESEQENDFAPIPAYDQIAAVEPVPTVAQPAPKFQGFVTPKQTTTSTTPITSTKKISREDRFTTGPQDNRYYELKEQRDGLREMYIKQGKLSDPNSKMDLANAIVFVGECQDMCPEFERHERELQNGLHEFEKIEGTNKADHARCVKRYRRSAAGDPIPLPSDVRPPKVLVKTLDYLFHTIIAEKGLEAAQPFVRDRCRSIRNDFTLQNYRGIEAVQCHERIARFHILCAFEFANHPTISLQQEQEQMRKTLQSLKEYYADMATHNTFSPNEAEFQAYYILSHMWQNEVITSLETMRPEVMHNPLVKLAVELQQLAQCATNPQPPTCGGSLNYYTRFFKLLEKAECPVLIGCVAMGEFNAVRRQALRAMQKSYYHFAPGFPLEDVVDLLGFDDAEEARKGLEYHGIKCQIRDGVEFAIIGKMPGGGSVRKQWFQEEQSVSLAHHVNWRLIKSKLEEMTISDVIDGNVPEFVGHGNDIRAKPSLKSKQLSITNDYSNQVTHQSKPEPLKPAVSWKDVEVPPPSVPVKPTPKVVLEKPAQTPAFTPTPKPSAAHVQAPIFTFKPPPSFNPVVTHSPPLPIPTVPFNPVQVSNSQPTPPKFVIRQIPPFKPKPALQEANRAPSSGKFTLPPELQAPILNLQPSSQFLPPSEIETTLITAFLDSAIRNVAVDACQEHNATLMAMESFVREATYSFCNVVIEEELLALEDLEVAADDFERQRIAKWTMKVWMRGAYNWASKRRKMMEERQERAVRFYLGILEGEKQGSGLGKALRFKSRKMHMLTNGDVSPDTFGSETPKNINEIDPSHFRHLDIDEIVFPQLLDSNTRSQRQSAKNGYRGRVSTAETGLIWKLLVSTPWNCSPDLVSAKSARSAHLNQFTSLWTRSKFGSGSEDGNALTSKHSNVSEELLRSRKEMWRRERTGLHDDPITRIQLALVVNHVSVKSYPTYPLKPNSESLGSGANAALFQFSVYVDGDKDEWWSLERIRLYSFLSSLPLGSSIPLLLLFWSTDLFSGEEGQMDAASILNIESFLVDNGGPISAVNFLCVGDTSNFDQYVSCEQFQGGVKWLSSMTQTLRAIKPGLFDDVVKGLMMDQIRLAARKLEDLAPLNEFGLDLEMNIATVDVILSSFNSQLEIIQELFASTVTIETPWPPRELANYQDLKHKGQVLPPLNWNDPKMIQQLSNLLATAKLPLLSEGYPEVTSYTTYSEGVMHIRNAYETHIAKLSQSSEVYARYLNKGNLLTSLWSHLAGFSRISMVSSEPVKFPFMKVAETFISFVVDAVIRASDELCDVAGWKSSRTPGGGLWYDAGKVVGCLEASLEAVKSQVASWQVEVVNGCWVERQEALLHPNGDDGYDEYDEDDDEGGEDDSDGKAQGQQEEVVLHEQVSVPIVAVAETGYTGLKRKLDAILAATRRDIELSKRRFG